MKSKEWNLMPVMLAWTGAIVIAAVLNFVFEPVINVDQIKQQMPH
jgi:hypothetical protein